MAYSSFRAISGVIDDAQKQSPCRPAHRGVDLIIYTGAIGDTQANIRPTPGRAGMTGKLPRSRRRGFTRIRLAGLSSLDMSWSLFTGAAEFGSAQLSSRELAHVGSILDGFSLYLMGLHGRRQMTCRYGAWAGQRRGFCPRSWPTMACASDRDTAGVVRQAPGRHFAVRDGTRHRCRHAATPSHEQIYRFRE